MLPCPFPSSSLSIIAAAGFLSCLGIVPVFAQTIEDGLDNPATLTPITTESTLLDGTDFPAGEWKYTTGTTHDGVNNDPMIRSTLPNRATSRLDTTVQGPATVSFLWKMDGGDTTGFDKLYFSSRNDFVNIGGDTDWTQQSFEVDTGSQPLRWFFERRSSNTGDTVEAFLDQLVITPIPERSDLQTALDNTTHPIYSNTDTGWTSAPFDGALNSTAAKSGEIAVNKISTMMFEVEGPATVRFHWGLVCDESDEESRLAIQINNQTVTSIGRTPTLEEVSLDLGPGTHGLKFIVQRSWDQEYASPEGYVDQLVIDEYDASPDLADAVDREGGVYSNSWTRQTQVNSDGSDAAMVTAPEIGKYRRIYVELPDEPGLFSFWYKMDADPNSGYFSALLDGMQILNRNGVSGWTKVELHLDQGFDRIFQARFIRYDDPTPNSPNTKVYLDQIMFSPGATNFQPDLSISTRAKKNRLKGVGLHNGSGAGQIAKIRARRARPIGEYVVRFQNGSSTDRDKIRVRGVGSRRHYQIFFVIEANGQKLNYSAALAAGIFETLRLNPKASETHEIWIAPKRKYQRNKKLRKRSHVLRVIGTSDADPRKIDVVRTKLVVKKR